jgi:hypothetical protein
VRAACALVAAAYVWPLDLPPEPTSSFGEYRSGHFHGGLDLSTRRANGHPVRAVAGGEAARVRASGGGYGRAVYLRLDDGRLAVYAHLDGFARDLEAWVEAAQESSGRYEFDRVPPPGRFRFAGGEVIGWSGESGAGPPHLHFEIREGETAINPQTVGLPLADHAPPAISALWAYPAAARSRVRERVEPVRVAVHREGSGFRLSGRLVVRGPVRVALQAHDRTHLLDNSLGLFAVTAALGEESVYEASFDSASWLLASEVDAVYDMVVRARGVQSALALTPPAGLGAGVVHRSSPSWERAPGRYPLRLEVRDAAGNRVRIEGEIEWIAPDSIPAATRGGTSPGGLTLELGPGRLTARSPAGTRLLVDPALAEAGPQPSAGERTWEIPASFEGPLRVRAVRDAPGGGETIVGQRRLRVAEIAPGWSRTVHSLDERFAITVDGGSAFEPQTVAIEEWDVMRGARAALGRVYNVMPEWLMLRAPVEVSLVPPDSAEREGLGLFESGSRDNLIGGADSTGRRLAGRTRRLGSFTARYDLVPPFLGAPRVRAAHAGAAGTRPARFSVRWTITDDQAGVASSDVTVEVDGRPVPVEYDLESAALVWRPRQRPDRGRHSYRIEARDRLGARALRSGDLQVP